MFLNDAYSKNIVTVMFLNDDDSKKTIVTVMFLNDAHNTSLRGHPQSKENETHTLSTYREHSRDHPLYWLTTMTAHTYLFFSFNSNTRN